MSSNICLLALIGLPAAGKTTFSQWLLEQEQLLDINIIHLCYDKILNLTSSELLNDFSYKIQRAEILHKIYQLVDDLKRKPANASQQHLENAIKSSSQKYILICDDNNYYRSMRYKLYQLCRNQQISYAQIYFESRFEDISERNANRSGRDIVPPSVLERMSRRMEEPIPIRMKWEKNTYILEANRDKYEDVINFLRNCFDNIPSSILLLNLNYKQSLLHELDLLLRKRLNELLKNVNAIEKQSKAKELNETRKEILEIFKSSTSKSVQEEKEDDEYLSLYVDMLF